MARLGTAIGRPIARAPFTAHLLAAFESRYRAYLAGGFAAVRAEWESYSCLTGKDVRVRVADGALTGRVRGIDIDGALLLAPRRGRGTIRVVAGEVTLVRRVARR